VKASGTKRKGAEPVFESEHRNTYYQKALDARKQPIRGLWVRNDRYYARVAVEDPNTGKKTVRRVPLEGATTVADALKELRKLLTKREDNALPVLKRTPKLEEYVKTYIAYLKTVKDSKRLSTIQKEDATLRLWCQHIGQTRLHHINKAMINAFIAKRQGAGMSGRTVNLDVIALRNILKRAIDDGWLKSLPTENLRPLKWTAKKRELFSAKQIEDLCAGAIKDSKNGQQFSDYVKLMAYCGARRSEALRLKWTDVDWQNKQITIGSDGLTKNREMRVVDFNPNLEKHLKEMTTRMAPDSEYLFPSPQRGDKDVPAKSFMETLKIARETSKVLLNFHDCRHFFISMAVMSGIDYMTIAKWVGHKDGGVLIGKVYGHLSNEHAQKQAQKLAFDPQVLPDDKKA